MGITFRVSVSCNDTYTEEEMVEDALTANLIIVQNTTADNIRCQLSVAIDAISLKINISLSKKIILYVILAIIILLHEVSVNVQ